MRAAKFSRSEQRFENHFRDWLREMVSHAMRAGSAPWALSCITPMIRFSMQASSRLGNLAGYVHRYAPRDAAVMAED